MRNVHNYNAFAHWPQTAPGQHVSKNRWGRNSTVHGLFIFIVALLWFYGFMFYAFMFYDFMFDDFIVLWIYGFRNSLNFSVDSDMISMVSEFLVNGFSQCSGPVFSQTDQILDLRISQLYKSNISKKGSRVFP